ncbi:uncharacterized protein V1518DRAFT_418920 [Limtongia smithiae]|uniref:uncharacterized protein n=1 Tax=Limtongia smithiae TaxID=1125753 RepID=UPI0034CF371D
MNEASRNDFYNLFECYLGYKNSKMAFYTIWEYIYLFPADSLGYLLAYRYYLQLEMPDQALKIATMGLDETDSKAPSYKKLREVVRKSRRIEPEPPTPPPEPVLTQPAGVCFLQLLPSEIEDYILSYLSTAEITRLRRVSSTWNEHLISMPRLWRALDFRDALRPVRYADALRYLSFAKRTLESAYIEKIATSDVDACLDEIMEACETQEYRLKVLEVSMSSFFFDSRELSEKRLLLFSNLTRLKLPLHDAGDFPLYLAHNVFPNLEDLFLLADADQHVNSSQRRDTEPTDFSMNQRRLWSYSPFERVRSNIKRFRVGSQASESAVHDYLDEYLADKDTNTLAIVMLFDLNNLIEVMPNLESFICVQVKTTTASTLENPEEHLCFRNNSKLTFINLSQSDFTQVPHYPSSMRTLITDSTNLYVPQIMGPIADIEVDEELLDQALRGKEFQVETYQNLEVLDLAACELGADALLEWLSYMDPNKLIELNLKLTWKYLNFTEQLTWSEIGMSSDVRNTGEKVMAAKFLVVLAPQLRKLNLSCTKINDECLRTFRELRDLEYLDISGCRITFSGLWYLLTGRASQKSGWSCSHLQTKLRTVILKDCKVSDEFREFLETNGICTGKYIDNDQLWGHLPFWKSRYLGTFA